MSTIEITRLSVAIEGNQILHDVDMHVEAGAWVGVIGPNGAGKTTLLRTIVRLVDDDGSVEGSVTLDGSDLGRDRRALARLIAYVPQQPLVPVGMPVVDYVLMGRTPYIPYFGVESRSDLAIVDDVLARLDLEGFGDRMLGSLSGGELQRAVLARALAQQAPILLLDEPTAALDVGHQQQVLELIDRLRRERELTVVSSMHDLSLAGQFAESLVLMDGGRVVATGLPHEVLTEASIRAHFGASVRVMVEDGNVVVVPRRERPAIRAVAP